MTEVEINPLQKRIESQNNAATEYFQNERFKKIHNRIGNVEKLITDLATTQKEILSILKRKAGKDV